MKKLVLLFLFLFSLIGCGTGLIQSVVDTPEVKGVELKSFSIKDKQALFEVALYNPNAFSLPVSGMIGDIVLNQMTIGHIDAKSEQSLAAHATQRVAVPIMLNPDVLGKAIKSVLNLQHAEYIFNGGVNTSVGEIPFSKKGSLSMKDLIAALFR